MRRLGRKDGKLERPGTNDDEAPELSALREAGEADVSRLAAWWHEIDNDLRGEWCGLKNERDRLAQRAMELEEPVTRAYTAYKERVKARDQIRKKIDALPSESRHRIGPRAYAVLMTLLFVGEFPLNAIAFRLFGESELLTYVLTTALAVSLIISAHALGIQIHNEKKNRIVVAIAVGVPILAVGAIAYVREEYLSSHAQFNEGLAQLDPIPAIIVFGIVNLFVYAGATLLSWARHDPHMRALTDADLEVKWAERQWQRCSEMLDAARALIAGIEGQLNELAGKGAGEFRKAKELVQAQKNDYEGLMDVYRAANYRARPRQDVVKALEERPQIEIPKDLQADEHPWVCEEPPEATRTQARVVLAPGRRHPVSRGVRWRRRSIRLR